uniref:Tail assembly chaperone n=1 Tax=viral metagenome TaxID=1070528 RepID=A0A6H1ZNS2_9ZZZZ
MSKIGSLATEPKVIKLGNEEFTLIPLTLGERKALVKLMDSEKKSEQTEAAIDLMKTVLKKSYPDMTEDEFNGISIKYLNDLGKAVMELHGIEVSEAELKKLMAGKESG